MAQDTLATRLSRIASSETLTAGNLIVRIVLIGLIDTLVVWFIVALTQRGNTILAVALAIIVVLVNVVLLRKDFYPVRWMLVGLALMVGDGQHQAGRQQ